MSAASAAITAVLVGTFWLSMLAVDFGREPNTAVAQIAAFVPPTAPMIVPTRVVAGDMGAVGLSVAVGLELLGTVGLIVLAARVYERAILRIGAPVRLRGLLSDGPQEREPTPRVPSADRRLRSGVAVLLAGAALVLIAGAGIVEIGLVVVGVVLVGLHGWGRRTAPRR